MSADYDHAQKLDPGPELEQANASAPSEAVDIELELQADAAAPDLTPTDNDIAAATAELDADPEPSLAVTFFKNDKALVKKERQLTSSQFIRIFNRTEAPTKSALPYFKLARFGDKKTERGCLRNDANVVAVTGIVGEHDAGTMPMIEAEERLVEHGIRALLYTTPSHTPEKPRWRVVVPFSGYMPVEDTELGKSEYKKTMNQLNYVLDGALAGESWVLSQAFHYGHVKDAEVQIRTTSGKHYFDALPLILPERPKAPKGSTGGSGPVQGRKGTISGVFESLPSGVRKAIEKPDFGKYGGDRSRLVWWVVCELLRLGWENNDILAILLNQGTWPQFTSHIYFRDHDCREPRTSPNPEQYAQQQINHAQEEVAAGWEFSTRGERLGNSTQNITKALKLMGVHLRYHAFADAYLVTGLPVPGKEDERELGDFEEGALTTHIQKNFHLLPQESFMWKVLRTLGEGDRFHPVCERLSELQAKWDGVKRLDTWLEKYLGAKTELEGVDITRYVRSVSRKVLIAAVHRVRVPGCKFDTMLILVNPMQGTGKSTMVETLALDPEWFTDAVECVHLSSKLLMEQTAGKWIVEIGELSKMRDVHVNELKSSLSRKADRARMAYGRTATERKRQFIFIGTTNNLRFLKDRTGNRRFWPIDQEGQIDLEALKSDIPQLLAEAAQAESEGESIILERELWEMAEGVQEGHAVSDPWEEVLREALGDLEGKIFQDDIWKLLGFTDISKRAPKDAERRNDVMQAIGFRYEKQRIQGQTKNCFVKGDRPPYKEIVIRMDDMDGPRYVAEYVPNADLMGKPLEDDNDASF